MSFETGAIETPGAVGHVLGELLFRLVFGTEILDVAFAEGEISFQILVRHDHDLAGEAVPEGIQAGALLAFGRTRTGGVLRVFAIGREFQIRYRHVIPSGMDSRFECGMGV